MPAYKRADTFILQMKCTPPNTFYPLDSDLPTLVFEYFIYFLDLAHNYIILMLMWKCILLRGGGTCRLTNIVPLTTIVIMVNEKKKLIFIHIHKEEDTLV